MVSKTIRCGTRNSSGVNVQAKAIAIAACSWQPCFASNPSLLPVLLPVLLKFHRSNMPQQCIEDLHSTIRIQKMMHWFLTVAECMASNTRHMQLRPNRSALCGGHLGTRTKDDMLPGQATAGHTCCLFFETPALIPASASFASLSSRFEVSPAFDEFCTTTTTSLS